MPFLIIDTSSSTALLAIGDKEQILDWKTLEGGTSLSETLFPTLATFCPEPPEWIAVGRGPGSYTGTRLGMITARALAFAWSIPLVGFCSLKAFLPIDQGKFISLMPAKSGATYFLKGMMRQGQLSCCTHGLVDDPTPHFQGVDVIIAPPEIQNLPLPILPPNLNPLPLAGLAYQKFLRKELGAELLYLHNYSAILECYPSQSLNPIG